MEALSKTFFLIISNTWLQNVETEKYRKELRTQSIFPDVLIYPVTRSKTKNKNHPKLTVFLGALEASLAVTRRWESQYLNLDHWGG